MTPREAVTPADQRRHVITGFTHRTTRRRIVRASERLQENTDAVDVELAPKDLQEITQAADRVEVQGERYPEHMQRWIDR